LIVPTTETGYRPFSDVAEIEAKRQELLRAEKERQEKERKEQEEQMQALLSASGIVEEKKEESLPDTGTCTMVSLCVS